MYKPLKKILTFPSKFYYYKNLPPPQKKYTQNLTELKKQTNKQTNKKQKTPFS